MLRHAVLSLENANVLIVATYRDDAMPDHLADLLADFRRSASVERVAVGGLAPSGIAELIELEAPGELAIADRRTLASAIHADTHGNAFFATELVRHVVETGNLASFGSSRQAGPILPNSVLEVVTRRISRFDKTARDALLIASVIGPKFTLEVVSSASDISVDEALDGMETAVEARLVFEHPEEADCYTFAHALVRTALYHSISPNRRRRMHGRVGEVLEAAGLSDTGILAYHFAEAASGSDVHKAVTLCYAAGVAALERRLYGDAADHLRRAIDLTSRAPDLPVAERSRVALAAAEALNRVGDISTARACYLEAATLARELADAEDFTRAAAGYAAVIDSRDEDSVRVALALCDQSLADDTVVSPAARAAVLSRSARWLRAGGADSQADERARQALSLANDTGDVNLVADVLRNQYWSFEGPATTASRLAIATELLRRRRARRKRDVDARGEGVADAASARTGTHRRIRVRTSRDDRTCRRRPRSSVRVVRDHVSGDADDHRGTIRRSRAVDRGRRRSRARRTEPPSGTSSRRSLSRTVRGGRGAPNLHAAVGSRPTARAPSRGGGTVSAGSVR